MKDTERGLCFRTPLPVCRSQDESSYCPEAKRMKLCSNPSPSRVSSVYSRIFERKTRPISGQDKSRDNQSSWNGSSFRNLVRFIFHFLLRYPSEDISASVYKSKCV
ncbi:unnamed protein product, partial [Heterobilharzia americana]